MTSIDVKYRTTATVTGGRDGRTQTEDGKIDLQLDITQELGGEGTNPEQLFAAGYAACFLSAIKHAAQQLRVRVSIDPAVTTAVGIGMRAEAGFEITVEIQVNLPGVDQAIARQAPCRILPVRRPRASSAMPAGWLR